MESIASDIVLLDSGCVCCQIHRELQDAILDLYTKRENHDIPPFKRIIIETTGLAEPGPIASTIFSDPVLSNHFQLKNIVTVVDAQLSSQIADIREEWVKQVAAANVIYLSKTNLIKDDATDILDIVHKINPTAQIISAKEAQKLSSILFNELPDLASSYKNNQLPHQTQNSISHAQHTHISEENGISSFILNFDQDMDWVRFGFWFSAMLQAYGTQILRVKDILNIGDNKIISFNAVQHIVYPPSLLQETPKGWKGSQLVFIVRNLSSQKVIHSFEHFIIHN